MNCMAICVTVWVLSTSKNFHLYILKLYFVNNIKVSEPETGKIIIEPWHDKTYKIM